jgi:hypothetical protein
MINNFFFFENLVIYGITCKNIVKEGRPQMKIWRMHISHWTPKATNKHSEYVIFTAFTLQQWLHERASMLSYTFIVFPV